MRGAFDGGRLGIFVRNDGHWLVEEQLAGKREATRLGRVLEPPGVTYTTANAPQATGRVGRFEGVSEGRLTDGLRLPDEKRFPVR